MIVGVRQWDLQLFGCHSLKEKRSILQSLKAALRNGLNVAVAETGHSLKEKRSILQSLKAALRNGLNVAVAETGQQDVWQRAEIACTTVASDRKIAEEVLRSADRIVERADGVRIIDTMTSFL